ncbi:hypothetical protein EXIGLDRAFT_31867 [Exidia glandulosa HHB12029]|uniref:Uncharacterized protein n=1 Tax=Exidia glandulosa HHB12029 TaxID=1314781 RepID=A0A165IUN8_EXIGL|nr:hypothetical protein EXIGLDRAFT_31867 [Exidia glandulosa HHB12029]
MWFWCGCVSAHRDALANSLRTKQDSKDAGGAASATTIISAAAEATTVDDLAAVDMGIKAVVQMCLNADGKTGSFGILGVFKVSAAAPTGKEFAQERIPTDCLATRQFIHLRFTVDPPPSITHRASVWLMSGWRADALWHVACSPTPPHF